MGRVQLTSEKAKAAALPRRGQRHPLLLQRRLRDMLFWPALLIALLVMALVVLSPPGFADYRPFLVVAGIGAFSVALLTVWFSLVSFVCCRADGLFVRLPFYQLLIPYSDIQATRLAQFGLQFPPETETWSRRRFLEPLFFSSVVIVELNQLPVSRFQLRLWMSRHLLAPDRPGLMLPVRDWISFRGELDEYRSRSTIRRGT